MHNLRVDNRTQYSQSFYQLVWQLETFIRTTWSQLAEDWLGYHSTSPPLLKISRASAVWKKIKVENMMEAREAIL